MIIYYKQFIHIVNICLNNNYDDNGDDDNNKQLLILCSTLWKIKKNKHLKRATLCFTDKDEWTEQFQSTLFIWQNVCFVYPPPLSATCEKVSENN